MVILRSVSVFIGWTHHVPLHAKSSHVGMSFRGYLLLSLNSPHLSTVYPIQVALVVIDSIAFPFRQDVVFQTESNMNKAKMVNIMARELCTMASQRTISVSWQDRRQGYGSKKMAEVLVCVLCYADCPDQPNDN